MILVLAMLLMALPTWAGATNGDILRDAAVRMDELVVHEAQVDDCDGLVQAIADASSDPGVVTNIFLSDGGALVLTETIVIVGKRINIEATGTTLTIKAAADVGRHFHMIDSEVMLKGFGLDGQANGARFLQQANGGIRQTGGSLTISGMTISNCAVGSDSNGGGVLVEDNGTFVIENSTVRENTAGGYGGGIYVDAGSTLIARGGTIRENAASAGGGLYTERYDAIQITDTKFLYNSADEPILMDPARTGIAEYYNEYLKPSDVSSYLQDGTSTKFTYLINNYDVYFRASVIAYNANGAEGTPPPTDIAVSGIGVLAPEAGDLAIVGMRFIGWGETADAEAALYAPGDSIPADGDIELFALWEYIRYTLSYNVGGGTGAPEDETVIYGNHPLSTQIPTHEDADDMTVLFIGWTTDEPAGIYGKDSPSAPETVDSVNIVDDNVTVYAAWGYDENGNGAADVTEEKFNLTYDTNGGIEPNIVTENLLAQSGYALDAVPPTHAHEADTPVVFIGWTADMNDTIYAFDDTAPATVDTVDIVDEDVTVYAAWGYDADETGIADVLETPMPVIHPVTEGDEEVTGTGIPDAKVEVTFPDVDEPVVVEVDEDGNWTAPLPEGYVPQADDLITAIQTEDDKLPSGTTETVVLPIVPKAQTETPIIDPVTEGDEEVNGTGVPGAWVEVTFPDVDEPVLVEVDEDGNWTAPLPEGYVPEVGDVITAIQTEDGKDPSERATTTVKEDDSDKPEEEQKSVPPTIAPVFENDNAVSGGGVPESSVTVTFEDGSTVTVPVKDDGTWTAKVPDGVVLEAGDPISATQTEPGKLESDEATVGVTRGENPNGPQDADQSEPPKINTVTKGDDEVTGTGVPGAEVEVTFPDVDEPVVVEVGADGKWTAPLPEGYVPDTGDVITATQTEPGKNPSAEVETIVKKPATPGNNNGGVGGGNKGGGNTTVDDDKTPLGPGQGVLPYGKRIPYIFGYTDGSVRLDNNITRAEVAAIFFRLLEDKDKDKPLVAQFTDMTGNEWYAQSVAYLNKIGVLTGYPDGRFGGENCITRAEFAAIVTRFEALATTKENPFFDVAADYWAADYIRSAAAKGWVSGYVDGSFRPNANILRSETIKIINIMLDRVTTVEDWVEVDCLFNDVATAHWAYAHMMESSIEDATPATAD